VSVLVIAVTGVIRALSELHSVSQVWSTGYGRALVVKTAVLAALVGLGWVNRYRLVPRSSVAGLRRTVAAELALFAVLGAAFAPLAGRVTVTVDGRKLEFRLPTRVQPAGALVAHATRVFRALRSVDYVERLASSPRDHVVSDFTLERPNRLEYRIRGGASGIIIGSRRWDRAGRGKWEPSAQEPTPQPEPIWAGHVTNAFLLATTPSSYVVAFMKPLGPTWFTLTLNRRTLLPRDMRMTT